MSKTIIVILGLILLLQAVMMIFGGISIGEIKDKVESAESNVTIAKDSIEAAIKNINDVKNAISEAKEKIDLTNLDLINVNIKLRSEFGRIRNDIKDLEERRNELDKQIEAIKSMIPGEPKELREPEYLRVGG